MTQILQTTRLNLRQYNTDDYQFIIELLNTEGWLKYIGNRNIKTKEDAIAYIENSLINVYKRLGFGMYMVELKHSNTPIGMCGLIKRDFLDDVDIGFALLPAYNSQGYGYEAASAVLKYAFEQLDLKRILAITSLDNETSGKLLNKLGLNYIDTIFIKEYNENLKLFGIDKS